jgi:hypothetical protein
MDALYPSMGPIVDQSSVLPVYICALHCTPVVQSTSETMALLLRRRLLHPTLQITVSLAVL